MKEFYKNTKNLARSPLGIIALFISLIYGFACLVLSTASTNLESNERILLIWFLILFPIIILISFLFLVTKHHRKLYGPSDFKDEKIFLETIDIKTQKKVLIESTDLKSKERQDDNYSLPKSERLKQYLIAENLTLRVIEKEYNSPIRRNVKFKGHKNTFDGIIEKDRIIIGIEIKYFDKIDIDYIQPIALHYKRILHVFQRVMYQHYSEYMHLFELIIVMNKSNLEFKKELQKIYSKESNFKLRFLDFDTLKNQFGINDITPHNSKV